MNLYCLRAWIECSRIASFFGVGTMSSQQMVSTGQADVARVELPDHTTRVAAHWRYWAVGISWALAAFTIKPFLAYVDFGVFYSTAIERILAGRPLDIYSFVARPAGSDLAIPLSQPPVWFFYLSPWYWLGNLLGFADFRRQVGTSYGQAWMLLASIPFDVILCLSIVRLAEGARRFAEPGRLALFACLLCSPLLWLSSVRYGHNESAMVMFVLLAVALGERCRPGWSGLFWGLALGVKTTAIAPALVYFGWGLGKGRRRSTMFSGMVAAATFIVPLLPYLLLRREQTSYALFGFEQLRPVGGYVVWKLLSDPASAVMVSNGLILGVSALLGLMMARRSGDTFLNSGGAWALVLGQVALLFFAKAVYVWYGLAASCFLFLAVARERRCDRTLIWPLVASLGLWMFQGGAWVAGTVTPAIQMRSALWGVFLLAIAALVVTQFLRRTSAAVSAEVPRLTDDREGSAADDAIASSVRQSTRIEVGD